MARIITGLPAHDAALVAAEQTRQVALAGMPTQAAARTADIAYARAALASCKANNGGIGATFWQEMLMELGTGGT